MSQYSEIIGSFIRTGNFPIEADYIFSSEEELKEFYNDELNHTILHNGLLKVVANDEGQSLWWVTTNSDGEYEFTQLIDNIDINTIYSQIDQLVSDLQQEIADRTNADNDLRGAEDLTGFPEDLTSLLQLANALVDLRDDLENTKSQLRAVVGTEDTDIVSYLETLPYHTLTEVANVLDAFINGTDDTTDTIDTLPELVAFLEGYTNADTLKQVLLDLVLNLMGDPLPTEDFRTLRGIEDFVRTLKSESEDTDANLQTELDQTQVGVGLSGDGSYNADKETYYLTDATSVMNALKTLDAKVHEAIVGISLDISNDDVVDLSVTQNANNTVISAKLLLSDTSGNQLIKKSDGLYYNVVSEYDSGILTLKVNDTIVAQHTLGLSAIVDSAYNDTSNEQIVIIFKLDSGDTQTVNIPVGSLIREWDVDNSIEDKVVELTRDVVIDGQDKLSADVRIYSDKHNILQKVGNALYVEGTTDNITYNDSTLTDVISRLQNDTGEYQAGDNITIEDNVISAIIPETDLSDYYTKEEADENLSEQLGQYATTNDVDEAVNDLTEKINSKQDPLEAGANITIENNVISATGGSTVDLTDYYTKEEVDAKIQELLDNIWGVLQ